MLSPGGRSFLQGGDHGGGVGGIGHQEDLVRPDVVGDQIVDDTAGLVAAQRVLGLARLDAIEVVGECGVDEPRGAGPANQRLAQVADVEQTDGIAGRGVLGDGAGIRHRHQPAAELGETRAQLAVAVLQRSVQQVAHDISP